MTAPEERASRSLLGRVGAIVAAYVVAGVLAGVLWERWWDTPTGLAYGGQWFLEPAGPDFAFEPVALFVLIAATTGLVLAVVAGLRRGHEVATVWAVLVGACLASVVMYAVGTSLGPGDPQALAAGQPDFTPIPSELGLNAPDMGRTPYLSTALVAFPFGAMAGLVGLFLLGEKRWARRRRG